MRRYAKYKDSGIPWIGEVPEHWKIEPFGRFFKCQKGLNITKADLTASGEKVISYGQIHSKTNSGTGVNDTLFRFVSPAYLSETPQAIAQINDFLFADTSEDLAGCGNCVFIDNNETIFAGYHTLICRPYKYEMPRFLAYLFLSAGWRNQLQANCNGVKVYSISRGKLKKTSILVPSLPEQRAIVDYLDSAVGKIDAYVAEKESEIEKLGLLKQSVIAHAVTKGINPNAKMKDSGIPWIGEVPEIWNIKRLAIGFAENKTKNNAYLFHSAYKFNYGTLVSKNELGNLDELKDTYVSYTILKKDDIVINCLNLNYDFVSLRVAHAPTTGIITSAYLIITPRKGLDSDFYTYFFKAVDSHKLFHGMGTGIRLTLSFSDLKKMPIPIPPLSEQRAIVEFIDGKVREIDGFIAAVREQIEKLKLYKQRLISDVVTGKIKVCKEEDHE